MKQNKVQNNCRNSQINKEKKTNSNFIEKDVTRVHSAEANHTMGKTHHDGASDEINNGSVRLNKYLSETGICSRREADRLIEECKVTINGKIAGIGVRVQENDSIKVNGRLIQSKQRPVYILLNKPKGITCTTDQSEPDNIIDFIKYPGRIFPVGRLDKFSEGLIMLTNDGDIVNKILRAGNLHEKEYMVTVDRFVTPEFIRRMSQGIPILGTVTQKCTVKKEGEHVFSIVLTQGLNRQIRRMCEYMGYQVKKLKRIRIMNLTVEGLPVGQWRHLNRSEADFLLKMVADSKKTKDASIIEE